MAASWCWRHALRNALIPIVTVVGLFLGILIGNSVLTEIVFNRPGLGKLIVGALNQRDYTMLQGMMVIYTLIVVAVNVLTDLVYGLVDPRVQTAMTAARIGTPLPFEIHGRALASRACARLFAPTSTSSIGAGAVPGHRADRRSRRRC